MTTPNPEPTPPVDPEPTTPAPTEQQGDPADLGDAGKRALAAERNARRAAEQSAAALQAKLNEIDQQNMTELQRAQAESQQHKEVAARATTEALRWKVAARFGISAEPNEDGSPSDAELILTGADEQSMTLIAQRWAARAASQPAPTPRPDPGQGPRPSAPEAEADAEYARFYPTPAAR